MWKFIFIGCKYKLSLHVFLSSALGNIDILNVLYTIQYFIQEVEKKTKYLSKGEILRLSLHKRFPKIKGKKNLKSKTRI